VVWLKEFFNRQRDRYHKSVLVGVVFVDGEKKKDEENAGLI
jgi:hypothetical protein